MYDPVPTSVAQLSVQGDLEATEAKPSRPPDS